MKSPAFLPAPPCAGRGALAAGTQRAFCPSSHALPAARRAQSKAAARMLVVDVGSTEEMDKVLDGAGESLVVVDFSTTWCGPCKIISPVFEEMSDRFENVVFVKVMGDATPETGELMKREGIRAVPAFHFWKNRERVLHFTGAKATAIEEGIVQHM